MENSTKAEPMRIAFIHPDLGIGGAERLVVDAALGLQSRGHQVEIYTSHHDPKHCFEETKNGQLRVHNVTPPFPRAIKGKFHILFAHLRQLHLTARLLLPWISPSYDVYFVDQLSTCVPFLRLLGTTRVVFYCHFPDKLLANGAFVEGGFEKKSVGLLKAVYRFPMDWWEEVTTRQADIILANSKFTARVFKAYFKSISTTPRVVYPGINLAQQSYDETDLDVIMVLSNRPTLLSLNRFEKKKNIGLGIQAFALTKSHIASPSDLRLVVAGGYDPRVEENMLTLYSLIDLAKSHSLTYHVIKPSSSSVKIPPLNSTPVDPDVLFLLNFTSPQRTALLQSKHTKALLYTPANEHFGIGPVEAMSCGTPVLACNSGGPTESIVDNPSERTGWLREPEPDVWAQTITEILDLSEDEREALGVRARERAEKLFSMEAMASSLEEVLVEAVLMGSAGVNSLWLILLGFVVAYGFGSFLSPGDMF